MNTNENNKNTENIPIFFASDNNYVPYLTIAIKSIIENASKDFNYNIYILNNGITEQNQNIILQMQNQNFSIEFVDVLEKIAPIADILGLRDYYTVAIYFRLFIANMFKNLDKALYLDCDIIVLGDISKLYKQELENNILGGVMDQIVSRNKFFRQYSKDALGVNYTNYINSGILVMNLKEFREQKIEEQFVSILKQYSFNTIAPDQDYLNFLCKNKIKSLDLSWNKECLRDSYKGELNLIHYAYFKKPWTDKYVKYEKYFWKYAKQTPFYSSLITKRNTDPISKKLERATAAKNLVKRAKQIYSSNYNFHKMLEYSYKSSNENINAPSQQIDFETQIEVCNA